MSIKIVFGQNYIPYYQKRIEAEVYFCQNKVQNALQSYQEAFSIKPALAGDLYNASICAALLNQDSLMFLFVESCLESGVEMKIFTQNIAVFKKYFENPKWQELLEKSKIYYDNYLSKLNWEYINLLKSLTEKDQAVRKKIKPYMFNHRNLQISKKRIRNMIIVDSCNNIIIDSLINLYGYPNRENVGIHYQIKHPDFICLWHRVDSLFVDIVYNAMLNGDVLPESYAEKKEYATRRFLYGTMYTYKKKITQQEREFINKNRLQIGMKTIEEDEIVRKYFDETKYKYKFYCDFNFLK